MNLKHLTDDTLISETKRLVREERAHLTVILHHLREIDRRRLYTEYKCNSLQVYAEKELGYSASEAQRRISAMLTIRAMPEVEEKIASGEINLTHINIAHSLFESEKRQGRAFTTEKKAEVFESIAGTSTREAQKALFDFAPAAPKIPDQIKPVGKNRNLMKIEISDETLEKLKRVQGLKAHENLDLDQLVSQMCDLSLEEWSPTKPAKVQRVKESRAEIRRQIWRRDGSKCTKCSSYHRVQEDHIIPESMGGEYTYENMRLLCRACNQRAAIEKLGQDKMDRYLKPSAPKVKDFESLERGESRNNRQPGPSRNTCPNRVPVAP